MFIQNVNMMVSRPDVLLERSLYCIKNSIPINYVFQENFPTNTQVFNLCQPFPMMVIQIIHIDPNRSANDGSKQ